MSERTYTLEQSDEYCQIIYTDDYGEDAIAASGPCDKPGPIMSKFETHINTAKIHLASVILNKSQDNPSLDTTGLVQLWDMLSGKYKIDKEDSEKLIVDSSQIGYKNK